MPFRDKRKIAPYIMERTPYIVTRTPYITEIPHCIIYLELVMMQSARRYFPPSYPACGYNREGWWRDGDASGEIKKGVYRQALKKICE